MAKQPPAPKQRWYQTLWQAYKVTARADKPLPYILGAAFAVPVLAGVGIAVAIGGLAPWIYGPLGGVSVGVLAALWLLTRRFEKAMFAQMEGQLGGSLAIAQSIRNGWSFTDEPVAIDTKGKWLIFRGVGKGGVVLLVEGGQGAKRNVQQLTARLNKVVPGVPVSALYVGTGEGEVPLKTLPKAVRATRREHFGRGLGKGLSNNEIAAVNSRLRAMGGASIPVPKGIDPTKARADRKALRGR